MTEKEIRQEAEDRYLFPAVEYDDYDFLAGKPTILMVG